MYRPLERLIYGNKKLDQLAEPMQKYVNGLFGGAGQAGKVAKNALNGVWLGHPLHPALVTVPVGAWTCTVVLDRVAQVGHDRGVERAADITLLIGLAGAASSAVTGWTQWSDTYGKDRELGLVHGLAMVASTSLYIASSIARLSGSRRAGVRLADAGMVLTGIGAYLGGDEAYDLGYGVNRTAWDQPPKRFTPVMKEEELESDKPAKVKAGKVDVLLVKQSDQIFALNDTCTHAGCSLAGGHLQGRTIICSCHGSQFDLRDGTVLNGPATRPEPHFEVRVRDGMIEVKGA